MRTLGNVLWLVLAGWWLAIGYVIAGVVACLLIVTIPFGVQAFKLAGYTLWPFGRVVVPRVDGDPALGIVGNVVWVILFGSALLCRTVVCVPFGKGDGARRSSSSARRRFAMRSHTCAHPKRVEIQGRALKVPSAAAKLLRRGQIQWNG